MSLGNWLYYRKKFKLFVLAGKASAKHGKTILALTYENNWMLPKGYAVNYFSPNTSATFIQKPDMVIEREFNDGKAEYSYLYDHSLKEISPKIFWFIDAHVADEKRIRYCDNFDFVFVAQSPYISRVKEISGCKNVFWLPLCFPGPATTITPNRELRKYAVSFVGSYGEGYTKRNSMISFLQQEYGDNFFVTTDFQHTKKLIQQSKVTTNYSARDDLNFRVFETLGYGTALVTNHVPDIDKIEGLDNRLACFHEYSELKQQIDKLVTNEGGAAYDPGNTQQWIRKNHSMDNRLAEMLQMVETGKQLEYK